MSPRELRVGPHTIRLEPPDLIVITVVGDIEAEHTRALMAEMHEFAREHPNPFIIMDATQLGRFQPAARTAGMSLDRTAHGRAFALVGATFRHRVLLTLLAKAIALLSKVPEAPIAFFDTQAEARVWFDSQK